MVNMAGAHDDDNITFGVLFYAYITTVEEEENQPERRTRRAAVSVQFWVRPWLISTDSNLAIFLAFYRHSTEMS